MSSLIDDPNEGRVPRVIVVGGGVGGLAVASRLAKSVPCNMTILEKNPQLGGRSGSVRVSLPQQRGQFRHETGPSLLLLPHVYRRIFEECGTKDMEDYGLVLKPCIPAYRVVFEDGDWVDVGFPRQAELSPVEQGKLDHAEKISRAKMNSFETNGSIKWDAYLRACEAFLDCGLSNFIEERLDLASFPAFLHESLKDFAKAWPLKPHSDVLDAFFKSNKLKALASFQDLYVGLEPYRNDKQILGGVLDSTAPAVFGLLSAIELHPDNKKCGVYAPLGGFCKVSDSLFALAEECGVGCRTSTVTQVTSEGVWHRPESSSADQEVTFEPADLVIVNADLPYASRSLLHDFDPATEMFDWDDGYRFSSGVIAFHWSLDKTLDTLNTHNVFLYADNREDMEASWNALRDPSNATALLDKETPFNFYVHRASKTDPSAAPEVRSCQRGLFASSVNCSLMYSPKHCYNCNDREWTPSWSSCPVPFCNEMPTWAGRIDRTLLPITIPAFPQLPFTPPVKRCCIECPCWNPVYGITFCTNPSTRPARMRDGTTWERERPLPCLTAWVN